MPAWQFVNSKTIGTNRGPGNRGDVIAFLNPVLDQVPDQQPKVLDVGCNTAWLAHVFVNYFGIDSDSNSIHVAQNFWERESRWTQDEVKKRIREVSPAEEWPTDFNDFDGIILRDVLEHVPDSSRLFKLAVARLKPEGWIFISAPDAQRWMWNDPTHVRPLPLQAQKWLAQLVGAELIHQGYESVAPGTQKIAKLFNERSPVFIRLLSRFRWWPRNCLSLIRLPSETP